MPPAAKSAKGGLKPLVDCASAPLGYGHFNFRQRRDFMEELTGTRQHPLRFSVTAGPGPPAWIHPSQGVIRKTLAAPAVMLRRPLALPNLTRP